MLTPVILSGGAGTRLWPMSTDARPKPFLPLVDDGDLYSATLHRVGDAQRFRAPIVVASARHADLCQPPLTAMAGAPMLILEPVARNTAPAVALAALAAQGRDGPDALLLVMPSDHRMANPAAFIAAVDAGQAAAIAGALVTFGITPSGPETGYGYLQLGDPFPNAPGVFHVERFIEKPAREAAEAMLAEGHHLWNAGIFLFRADRFLAELGQHAPAMLAAAEATMAGAQVADGAIHPEAASMQACPSDSIDYAVMERAANVAAVPMDPGWSDIGSWDVLADLDQRGGTHGPVTLLDSERVYARSDGLRIAALGVEDLIIVASGRDVLILPRGRSQEVKRLLDAMRERDDGS